MSRKENTAESTGSGAEQASTNGHNGFVIDLPADYGKRAKVNGDTEVDMNGRRPGEDGYNIFNKQSTTEKRRQQSEADAAERAVSDERLTRFGKLRFDVAALDGMNAWWARKLAEKIAAKNAALNPTIAAPELMFSGADAVNAGASDAHIKALNALSPDEIQALTIRAAAMLEGTRTRVRQMGRRIAAERDAAVPAPDPVSLAALLDEPDEGATYRVGLLWPTAGRVLLAAPFKSGKSTLIGNLIRVLVDGGQFLDRFEARPVAKVVLIDTELDRRTLRRWLRAQGIRNAAAVTVVPLRGAVSSFDVTDPTTRSEWAQNLAGADVVILDCLRPVLDALGLSEDKDAGRVLVGFDALLAEVGADEGLVVTHMGHQNERARGDSRLLDWPDALWKIVRGGDDDSDDEGRRPRYFSALGRDVAVAEGELTYDDQTRHLAYAGGSRKDSAARAALPELLALVRAEPGELSKNAVEVRLKDEHGITQRLARDAIAYAIKEGQIEVVPGPRNSKLLKPADEPVAVHLDPKAEDGETDQKQG
ncbi:AAA family ATPase [Mycobacteroides abscessus]|uniref:AAA family ATPase n=1 Tax=Mycobacteroides abscessus TaxID=36809 RepID=UPI002107802A|nr:AAA family ATPase [Mycobacteroides abscessus]